MSERTHTEHIEAIIEQHAIDTVKIGGADYDGIFRGKRLPADVFLDGMEHGLRRGTCSSGGISPRNWCRVCALRIGIPAMPTCVCCRISPHSAPCPGRQAHRHRNLRLHQRVRRARCCLAPSCAAPRAGAGRIARLPGRDGAGIRVSHLARGARSLREKQWRNLTALSPTTSCYSLARSTGDEFIVGRLRREMDAHERPIEGYNREHGEGMYEMNLRHASGLEAADRAYALSQRREGDLPARRADGQLHGEAVRRPGRQQRPSAPEPLEQRRG